MCKVIKIGSKVFVTLHDGTVLSKNASKEEYLDIIDNSNNEQWLKEFFIPGFKEIIKKELEFEQMIKDINDIEFLTYDPVDHCAIWLDISLHSLPEDFLKSIISAYKSGNDKELNAYKNFWTLLSLNPDEDVRKNLWWFLQLHGLVISSTGFFIAYRNVDKPDNDEYNEEGNLYYTDGHTHSMKIAIGQSVSMPREDCDCDSENECSYGLHVASKNWLRENYFGDTGMVVLVNPYNVVAVPRNSEYGKLRCCEYLPIDFAQYDNSGNIIPYDVETGFECKYAAQAIYEGIINIENDKYKILPPTSIINNTDTHVNDMLLQLAKECITNKYYVTL